MDDLIRRQDAIEYFMTNTNWHDEEGYTIDDAEDKRALLTEYFNGVPSADEYEIVKEYCHSRCLSLVDSAYLQYLIDFPIVPSAQQWIPCSKRLPEKDGHYIVYAPTYSGGSSSSKEYHDGVMFSAFKKGKWSIEHGYHKRPNCVVAWMPLPQPWKESEE